MECFWLFLALLVSVLLLGFLSVVFVLIWVLYYREGLQWNGQREEFNWHPVLLITGFVFVQGIAIIVYRLPWTWKCSKLLMKFIHAGLHTIALTLAIIALKAVFDFHNTLKIADMYSLHSWIGLVVVILYALQLALGLAVYLLPFAPVSVREAVMPIHVFSGLFIFGAVIATALMGITEKLVFTLIPPINPYTSFPEEGVFVNTLGVIILIFGALIFWMATRPHWKRPHEQRSLIHENPGERLKDEGMSDVEFNSEAAARKRNVNVDETGQRSTM